MPKTSADILNPRKLGMTTVKVWDPSPDADISIPQVIKLRDILAQ